MKTWLWKACLDTQAVASPQEEVSYKNRDSWLTLQRSRENHHESAWGFTSQLLLLEMRKKSRLREDKSQTSWSKEEVRENQPPAVSMSNRTCVLFYLQSSAIDSHHTPRQVCLVHCPQFFSLAKHWSHQRMTWPLSPWAIISFPEVSRKPE